jgi:hypothetical protein
VPIVSAVRVANRASKLGLLRPEGWMRGVRLATPPDERGCPKPTEFMREVMHAQQPLPSPADPAEELTEKPSPVSVVVAEPAPKEIVPPTPRAEQAKVFGRTVANGEAAPAKVVRELPPPTTPRRPVGPMRTPEREAKLRELVEARRGVHFTTTALNILPGPTMLTHDVVMWIDELGLSPEAVGPVGTARTSARARVLQEAFAVGDAIEHITMKLQHLDGPPIDVAAVCAWIADLRLKRTVLSDKAGCQDAKAPKLYPMDFNSAVRWAQDHRVALPRGCSDATAQQLINEARVEQGLRCWQLTEPRGRRVAV